MTFRSGMMLTLAASLVLAGCAAGTTAEGPAAGPSASGRTYAPGVRPRDTEFTKRATVALVQKAYDQALTAAEQGIAADSMNARHHFLAAQALAGLNRFDEAHEAYEKAQQIYPAYEEEIEPLREQAWATAFNEGVNAYNAQNTDAAVTAWENANLIYGLRPEGFQNLAALHTQKGDYDQAIAAYQSGLASLDRNPATRELTAEEQTERTEARSTMQENLAELLLYTERYADAEKLYRQQLARDSTSIALQGKLAASIAAQPGREAEAQTIYNRLLSMPNLGTDDYQSIGVALFNAKNYARAGEAFAKVAEARTNSRDAWYNYANSLYAGDQWTPLVPIAEKLVTLDPLHEDSYLILARAHKETKQNQKALQALEQIEAMPVKLKDLSLQAATNRTVVRGKVIGNKASAGMPVQVQFTFYDANGQTIGTQTARVSAPAKDAEADLEVALENATPAVGYKYQLVR